MSYRFADKAGSHAIDKLSNIEFEEYIIAVVPARAAAAGELLPLARSTHRSMKASQY